MARLRVRDEDVLKRTKPPRNPEGGWLPPNPKTLEDFYNRVQEEALRLFGVDEDNDACVLVRIVDNSREESDVLNFMPIPRDIEESPYHPYGKRKWNEYRRDPKTKKLMKPTHTPEEEETRRKAILDNHIWRLRMASLNAKIANDRVERFLKEEEFSLRNEMERPQRERNSRIKLLEIKKKQWEDSIKSYEDRGYVVDEKEGIYWRKNDERDVRILELKKPPNFDEEMAELKRLKAYKPAPEKTL